jgi:gluconate 2-dehydrogenase gamma chain
VNKNETSRRQFLRATGGTLGAAWIGMHWPELVAAAEHAHEVATGNADRNLKVLSPTQARDVEAMAAQIVPSGDTPGAREAGVVYFIDHVHAGPYAARAKTFLADLAGFQAEFASRNPGVASIADLPDGTQVAYLKSIETTPFFGTMKFLTVLGLLALPAYGGNAGKLGWRLVGFVDQHAWAPPFGHYDRDYPGFVPYPKAPRS